MKLEKLGGGQNHGLYKSETGVLYFRSQRNGKDFTKSLKTTRLTDARLMRDKLMVESFGQKPSLVLRPLALPLWDQWQTGMENTCRYNTAKSIHASRRHLAPHIKNLLLEELTADWWNRIYVPVKRAENPKRKFFNDRKWLSMMTKWAEENGKGPAGWRRPKFPDVDPVTEAGRSLTTEEVMRLASMATGDLKVQVIMAATMGMRSSEICKLPKSQVDMEKRVIRLTSSDTKTHQARSFLISGEAWPHLKRQIDAHPKSPWVFPKRGDPSRPQERDSKNRSWKELRRRAGVKCRFHDLRHTFITNAIRAGINPVKLCHYVGLSMEIMEKVYLHLTVEDGREVAGLVKLVSPDSPLPTDSK